MLRTRPLAATGFPAASMSSSSDEEARWWTEWDYDGAPDASERREVAFLAAWLKDNLFYPSSNASYEFAYLKVCLLEMNNGLMSARSRVRQRSECFRVQSMRSSECGEHKHIRRVPMSHSARTRPPVAMAVAGAEVEWFNACRARARESHRLTNFSIVTSGVEFSYTRNSAARAPAVRAHVTPEQIPQ